MKGNWQWYLLLGFSNLVFLSCDPCGKLDCISDSYNGQFRIVRSSDGQDMLFGSFSTLDKEKIRFYSLKGTDTTYYQTKAIPYAGTGYDSILHVTFYPPGNGAYIDLGNGDRDTLNITYQTKKIRCCGTITEITNFRFNNRVDLPGDKGVVELKK
jgi:hypothetical protein